MYKYLADGLFNGPIVKAYDACHCHQGSTCTQVTELDEAHQTFPITVKIDHIEDSGCLRSAALSQYVINHSPDHQHQPPPQHLHFFLGGLALSKALTYP